MRKIKNRLLLVVLVLSAVNTNAADSLRILTKNDFLGIVRSYHPVILQSGLQVNRAAADVQTARGGFDPMLRSNVDRKTFDGKLYYSYFNPEINIPTWYGVEFKAGVEEVVGDRVTSEASMGKSTYIGAKVPVNNLWFDKRRAVLRQAQAMKQLSEAERRLAINDVLYDGLSAYWTWVKDYLVYQVVTSAVAINEDRFRFVKTEYEQGARPAIDTTEAQAQLQNFYMQQNAARLAFMISGYELSNYLWLDNSQPVNWSDRVVPDTAEVNEVLSTGNYPSLNGILETLSSHPKLQSIGYKINVLEIEKKLKAQYLLPKLSLSGNVLSKGYGLPSEVTTPFLENNHKLGIDFSMPLLFREARGGYKAVNFKIQETNLEQQNIALQIENKVKSYYNEMVALQQQVVIFDGAYSNYQKLFAGERLRFGVGESSLFLLNTRENKVLESAQKMVELKTKWHKTYAGLMWAAGSLQ
jgi:outer membrane protein TolC